MPRPTRTLLDTREHSTAILIGYDGPRDPSEDGEGLILTDEQVCDGIPAITLFGPDGCVNLAGRAEIKAVIEALMVALGDKAEANWSRAA